MPRRPYEYLRTLFVLVVVAVGGCATTSPSDSGDESRTALRSEAILPPAEDIRPVLRYIDRTWQPLTRSHADLLAALPDEKVEHDPDQPWRLYVSQAEDIEAVRSQLRSSLGPDGMRQVQIERLPEDPRANVAEIEPHGLLYLPHPYVVPGGRFNEMYGWDSFFIQIGLLLSDEIDLAKAMVDNFVYEIEHYGTILNANRSYYLTRSQPPFLTAMILGVYEETQDDAWLESTLGAIDAYYRFWTTEPHLAGETGLSRYYDFGEGPAPEVVSGERDELGRSHYQRVKEFYALNDIEAYEESLYYDRALNELTPLFYKGDRSMRESGFDPSNRYGPFSVDIIHHAPVGLNALLYKMEEEAARIHRILERDTEAQRWEERAARRSDRMTEFLWDDDRGMYFDYNFREDRQSAYEFATTYYPLWVGQASLEQARRAAEKLHLFEAPGGLLTSTNVSGSQWDAPFGWAPLQLIAIEGLRRYGFRADADRLAARWISLITKEFAEHNVIVEKYDVVQRESDVESGIRFGYSSNEIGFGWTNAVYLALLRDLD